MIYIKLTLALLGGFFDRARGDDSKGYGKNADCFIWGLTLGYIHISTALIPSLSELLDIGIFSALFTAAMATGYGVPWGDYLNRREPNGKKEWWQFGTLPQKPLESLFVRGLIAALVLTPSYFIAGDIGPLVAVLASFPLGAYLGRYVYENNLLPNKIQARWISHKVQWDTAEMIRGWLISFIILGFEVI